MTDNKAHPVMGWHTDPDNPSRERWHQGIQWSDTYRPRPFAHIIDGGFNPSTLPRNTIAHRRARNVLRFKRLAARRAAMRAFLQKLNIL